MDQSAPVRTAEPWHGDVSIPLQGVRLSGFLDVPADARGLVLFAHGSGGRHRTPSNRLVAAVPVGAADSCREIAREVDLLVCPHEATDFTAVGEWHADFRPTGDAEVRELLAKPELHRAPGAARP